MRRVLAPLVVAAVVSLPLLPASAQEPTVVSLTFDSGFTSQMSAARLLRNHDMPGTFYLSSGYMTYDDYMGPAQLRALARMGHEIAGASSYRRHLVDMPRARAKAEICTDRQTLSQVSGVPVTSFAYPYGEVTDWLKDLVEDCGYNSARGVHGLYVARNDCSSCPKAESDPPRDPYYVRTGTAVHQTVSLEDLQTRVEEAEHRGGWLPLVFERVCDRQCLPNSVDIAVLTEFVEWLATRPNTQVLTVDEVVGGPTEPLDVGMSGAGPLGADRLTTKGSLSNAAAFYLGDYGVGQSQVVMAFAILGIALVLAFRWSTKNRRYVTDRVRALS